MRFWDSSALVPLLVREATTEAARAALVADPQIVVWWATRVECAGALVRRVREARSDRRIGVEGKAALGVLAADWTEVWPSEAVRVAAERLLAVHPLRTADALQLAAALIWSEGRPAGREFVCLDERLTTAAVTEGFSVNTL